MSKPTKPETTHRCSGTTRDGNACQWGAAFDVPDQHGRVVCLCLGHAAAAGNPGAIAEQRARAAKGRTGRARNAASRRRSRVPLGTAGQIRDYVERLAALAESATGDKLQRARAGAALAAQAHELLKSDVERQAREIEKLLRENPALARRLEVVK